MCRSKQTPLRRGFLFQGNANELRTVRPDPFHPGVLPRVFWAGVMMARQHSFLRVLWGVLVVGMSGPAFSEDYYWFRSGYTAQFPTPAAVCEFYKGSFSIPSWRPGDTHMTNVLVDWSNDRTTVKCRNASQPSDTNVNTYVINRGGDACPAGHTYNSTTGACEVQTCEPPNIELGGECVAPDPCESTTGSLISHQHKIRDSVLGSESSEPPS